MQKVHHPCRGDCCAPFQKWRHVRRCHFVSGAFGLKSVLPFFQCPPNAAICEMAREKSPRRDSVSGALAVATILWPFSTWRRTTAIFEMVARLFGACRHFENGDKIFATAGAPLTEPRRGDFLCAISQMAAFFVADAGFPGKVVFQFLVTTCREGTSPPRKWRHDCCHFSNGGFWVRHQCLGVISPPRQKWRRRKSAN